MESEAMSEQKTPAQIKAEQRAAIQADLLAQTRTDTQPPPFKSERLAAEHKAAAAPASATTPAPKAAK
jgi:hypothetical protein